MFHSKTTMDSTAIKGPSTVSSQKSKSVLKLPPITFLQAMSGTPNFVGVVDSVLTSTMPMLPCAKLSHFESPRSDLIKVKVAF